jgi:hypothetical protein
MKRALSLVAATALSVALFAISAQASSGDADRSFGSGVGPTSNVARRTAGAALAGSFIYEHATKYGAWLESRDLFGVSRVALTPALSMGERRSDCCASWSPDGTEVAFARKTPKIFGVFVVASDGSNLREVASGAALRQWVKQPSRINTKIWWAKDGSKLLFGVNVAQSCNSDGIYRVNADGSDLRPLWRRPSRLLADAFPLGWSPDGSRALYDLSHNDGDCYGSHIGPETLESIADDATASPKGLATTLTFGDAAWSSDGSRIAYTRCDEGDPCDLHTLDPATGQADRLTHYKTYASPYDGFDELPFLWSGSGEIIVGRFLRLLAIDATDRRSQPIVTVACPRPNGRCPLPDMTFYGLSPDGHLIFDVGDVGCVVCNAPSYGPKPVWKRYAFGLADGTLTPLPDPGLAVDDVYLP